jgi:hypothetical protein
MPSSPRRSRVGSPGSGVGFGFGVGFSRLGIDSNISRTVAQFFHFGGESEEETMVWPPGAWDFLRLSHGSRTEHLRSAPVGRGAFFAYLAYLAVGKMGRCQPSGGLAFVADL